MDTKRDAFAMELLCAFNGATVDQAPPAWWNYPNDDVREAWRRVADVARPPVGPFKIGQRVRKTTGDYAWVGDVRCCYQKRNGVWRIVSENDDALNHIFSANQLEAIP